MLVEQVLLSAGRQCRESGKGEDLEAGDETEEWDCIEACCVERWALTESVALDDTFRDR